MIMTLEDFANKYSRADGEPEYAPSLHPHGSAPLIALQPLAPQLLLPA